MKNKTKFTVFEYNPEIHDISDLVYKQALAVANGDCQMLPWEVEDGRITTPEELPFYVALIGNLAVAGAGLTQYYRSTNSVELGGAFVSPEFRGNRLYHALTATRLDFALTNGFSVVSFANNDSYPLLTSDFGMHKVSSESIPSEAFIPCATCNYNPHWGTPATAQTCCDRETIVMLNGSRVE